MKKTVSFFSSMLLASALLAQNYPTPDYANEVYYLKKDTGYTIQRLEKNSSKMDQSTKIMGGSEQSYTFDGDKSPVRFQGGSKMFFIFTNGNSSSSSSASSDSVMRANGFDPNMMNNMMGNMNDPAKSLTLYKADASKGGGRKIILMKAPGINPFGSHKVTSSDKYTFSVKKIREGYWEFQVDKTLPPGEYAFMTSGMGMGNYADMMGGNVTIFAFGID
jgi:hypothetical protein